MYKRFNNSDTTHQQIQWAIQNGKLVHISEVKTGLKCECICPSCHSQLIAKNNGPKKAPHFAHYNGQHCEYAAQTAIHLAAKEVFDEAKFVHLPNPYATLKQRSNSLYPKGNSIKVEIEKVSIETKLQNIIPDIILHFKGERKLLVEIAVTHFVDSKKLEKIKAMDISALEINLSKTERLLKREELKSLILERIENKTWLYNQKVNKEKMALLEQRRIQEKLVSDNNFAYREEQKRLEAKLKRHYLKVNEQTAGKEVKRWVAPCPLAKQLINNTPSANVDLDCKRCQYFHSSRFYREQGDYIICLKHNCDIATSLS